MKHKGNKVGYVRVSSFDQNPERQLEGLELDRKFTDKASGKSTNRPKLEEMIDYVREGDILIVHSMDRLARNLDDLRSIVFKLTGKKVAVQFLKENLTFTGEDSPMSNLLLSMMGAFAEFERSLIRERQLEGIAIAKKKGLYSGRKSVLSEEKMEEIDRLIENGDKKSEVARQLKISRETLYRYLRSKDSKNIQDGLSV
ncbi:MAG: recombinase family protein [Halobacteriovoraceae bacterium]|nr:recombinase family protein [Halobacteriovoraceae bacterium]